MNDLVERIKKEVRAYCDVPPCIHVLILWLLTEGLASPDRSPLRGWVYETVLRDFGTWLAGQHLAIAKYDTGSWSSLNWEVVLHEFARYAESRRLEAVARATEYRRNNRCVICAGQMGMGWPSCPACSEGTGPGRLARDGTAEAPVSAPAATGQIPNDP